MGRLGHRGLLGDESANANALPDETPRRHARAFFRYHRVMHARSLLRQLTRSPLANTCDSPWESMAGGDKVRHCASCNRDVYSLSDMSELEAELRLLNAGEAVPCIRYARDRDGRVAHLAPPSRRRFHVASASARALVVASALVARDAVAQGKDKANEPVQCVMLNALEPSPAASASAPSKGAPAAPAAAPAPPPPPVPLAGAPPPPQHQVAYGTLTIRSKVPRELELQGIKLQAPLAAFRMTPGDFVVEVNQPGKKKKLKIKFTITVDHETSLDLDKR
ncbi:MAG TPA: hypothetical protein VN947_01865 [Polyangia bacterium]|nr:hypothetical protein [Polyangia bacterium]